MEETKTTIVKTVRELLTTYDVTENHHCINERGNLLSDIHAELKKRLNEKDPELLKEADYFDINGNFTYREQARWDTNTERIAVFYVKGGSEGYYVHVEAYFEGKHKLIFLGKTLREGEMGITWAEKMVCALSRILEV